MFTEGRDCFRISYQNETLIRKKIMTNSEALYITNALEGKGYKCHFDTIEGGIVKLDQPVNKGQEYLPIRSAAGMRNFLHANGHRTN